MSAVAAPRSRPSAPRAALPRASASPRRFLIVACAAVLIGIVTLQVAVLRLNSERGDLQAHRDSVAEREQRAARPARRQG